MKEEQLRPQKNKATTEEKESNELNSAFKANATIEQLKQQCYEEATRKLLSNPSGTRMDIIYEAMAIYAAEILKEAGSFTYDDLTNHAKKDFYK